MEVLKIINEHAGRENVSFLVIGGHAVEAHGFNRSTGDLDLLVSKDSRAFWSKTLPQLGYEQLQDHPVFARFRQKDLRYWPIDLMFVSPDVFKQMYDDSEVKSLGDVEASVPSIEHLIALKLHALKQRLEHRETKDLLDVAELYRRSELSSEEFQLLCKKYDRVDVYEFIKSKSGKER